MIAEASLTAAFLVGLMGSGHCLGMCGGIAGSLAMSSGGRARALVPHLGRIGGYALLGGLAGVLGAALTLGGILPGSGVTLRVVLGLLFVGIGLGLVLDWRGLAGLERLGGRLWLRVQPLVAGARTVPGAGGALLVGMLWSLLPCGMVYSMLAVAAATGGPADGAAVMAAFGLGTLPSMAFGSLAFARWVRRLKQGAARKIAGAFLIGMGSWAIIGGILSSLEPAAGDGIHHHMTIAVAAPAG